MDSIYHTKIWQENKTYEDIPFYKDKEYSIPIEHIEYNWERSFDGIIYMNEVYGMHMSHGPKCCGCRSIPEEILLKWDQYGTDTKEGYMEELRPIMRYICPKCNIDNTLAIIGWLYDDKKVSYMIQYSCENSKNLLVT